MAVIPSKILKQSPLYEGGEGTIHEYNGMILKVYKNTVDINDKYQKVSALINKQLPANVIAPKEIAYDQNNRFIGYLMDKVDGEKLKSLSSKEYVKVNKITTENIIKMLVKIKDTLSELHKKHVYVGDMNDSNILFDKNFNIYFIDVDSYSLDNFSCDVAMESFKDPELVGNNFSDKTDDYAFSIMVFKSLTRLHPFGGTMDPDIPLLERMKKRMSVIDNSKVKVPRIVKKWDFMSPDLVKDLKDIYDNGKRFLPSDSLDNFAKNLKLCTKHNEFYYGKFTDCPLCNANATVVTKPVASGTMNGIPFMILFNGTDCHLVLSNNTYIDNSGNVKCMRSGTGIKFNNNHKYYCSTNGDVWFEVGDKNINISTKAGKYDFTKTNKSQVVVRDNVIYYIETNNTLTSLSVTDKGNVSKAVEKVSFNCYFDVFDEKKYLICNVYDHMKIINVNGFNYMLTNNKDKIQDYGIHYDKVTGHWLFIYFDSKGNFHTYVFDNNKLLFEDHNIKYSCNLGNLTFSNDVLFVPSDSKIRGFSYAKNAYKDFACDVVNEGSKLEREGNKFIIINEQQTYRMG